MHEKAVEEYGGMVLRLAFQRLKSQADAEDDAAQEVMEEVWALKPRDRDVIYFHYYEDYTIAEIADMLGENDKMK